MELSLTSRWYLAPGQEAAAVAALQNLAERVRTEEPGTLTYLVHRPLRGEAGPALVSLPPASDNLVEFFERYASPQAFRDHVEGPLFRQFVAEHGACFVGLAGKPFTTVQFLEPIAGFVERGIGESGQAAAANRHPAVMFEVLARDAAAMRAFYARVFGWNYQIDAGGFAYVHFPAGNPQLLGGIGQADANEPGFAAGHNFYLLVDQLEPVLAAALAACASPLMPPTSIDGYRLAMFTDPEGNPVGLIEPFGATANTGDRR